MALDLVVIGLGHVGLPLARAAVSAGLATAGYDVSDAVVSSLAAGRSPVGGVLDAEVTAMLDAGFHAAADPGILEGAQTVVICVPTGLTPEGLPDLSAVEDATAVVAARLRPGTLVVLESTSCPGTTEEVVRPLLERGSGLRAGEDFPLAYSPQRIDPGNGTWNVRNAPKIVGGCTSLCAKCAVAFYERFIDDLVVARGTREAEMAKLLENTYRSINIALVDEAALFRRRTGIDVWDVLHGAASKPFGFAPFRPGPGVGGHCVPVDPRDPAARAESQGFPFRMPAAAHDVLGRMPGHVVDRALTPLAEARGRTEGDDRALPRATDLQQALNQTDVAILLQDHSCYAREAPGRARCVLLDTRGKVAGSRVALL
ncbi:nucleotide sugar dehydrogenase [Streptomyces sp. NPDC046203]|uniref:nucleotide sugar dehydrogenase n=1 Tax=Streptomyces sp. NPDC046203 TaxID=3154602 RepID=UPI0033E4E769